ncbi:MAG: hypothetical protein CRU78_04560, partial [Candidatus Accumulibacter phosphatis]|nr:hypothetical protein [Candidatus Accumulibacter phosphatis]
MEEGMTNDGWQMPSPIDTLVHLGAGQCSELEAYLSVKPARLLLVECDPEAATALQARTAKLPNVQVLCNAVAGSAGPVVLYRYNVLGAGSLHPATGLLQLFPGMKPLEELPLEALAPTTLLEPLQLAAQEENLLVIDLPGEELPVLQALWDASTLQLFNQVKLCCGREPLYQGSAPAAQIVQWLGEHGFSLLLEEDSEDADYPCWTLQRNHLQLHNLELAQRLTGLEEQLQQSNQARDEQAKLVGEGKAQLDKLRQEHEEANKQLAEQKSLLEQSSQAKAAQEKLAAEWLAEIQQLSQAR